LIGITSANKLIDGILLIAAQTGYWKFWKGAEKLKMLMVWYFLVPVNRFHVVILLNKAMDTVRKLERKEHEALKGHKYTFLKTLVI